MVLYANYAYANYVWTLKADSHIACLAHSAPMPFPCHAVPLRVSFPFDLHSAAASDSHLPCHALTMPFFSRPQHSTAVSRKPSEINNIENQLDAIIMVYYAYANYVWTLKADSHIACRSPAMPCR